MSSKSPSFLARVFGKQVDDTICVRYLVRNPPCDADAPPNAPPHPPPVVFMHGLGFGIAQYLMTFIFLLRNIPSNQPLIVPLQPNVSHAILHPTHLVPLKREQWIEGLKGIIDEFGGERADVTMISHSLGSLAHCWMLKAYPELIKRSCFMDPGEAALDSYWYERPAGADV